MGRLSLFLTLSLLLFPLTSLLGQDSIQVEFNKGNESYASGNFSDAISHYKNALESGGRDWRLFYNLGNAYYKNGEIGKAIANYLKAFRISPRKGDVIYNLNFSLSKVGETFVPTGAFPRLGWRTYYILSLNELTLILSIGFLFLLVLLVAKFFKSFKIKSNYITWNISVLLVFAALFSVRFYEEVARDYGIVIMNKAEVRSGPGSNFMSNFTVPEGRRVIVLKRTKDWLEIGVPKEGLKGWVESSAVELIPSL